MLAAVSMVLGLACLSLLPLVATQRRTALPDHADRGLRHDRLSHALGIGAALLAAVMAGLWAIDAHTMRGDLGIPLFMGLAAGLGYVAAQTGCQLLWPRPAGAHRRADLTPRGPSDVTSPMARQLMGLAAVVLGVAITAPALLAPLDGPTFGAQDIYRAGWDQPPSAVNTVRQILGLGWPGLRYGFPALIAAASLLLLMWLSLRVIADRPKIADVSAAVDHDMRRTVARRVVAAAGGTIAFAGGWFALSAGSRIIETGTDWTLTGGWILLILGVAWSAAGAAAAVAGVLWPTRRPLARSTADTARR
jgi:hypothetical protein